MNWYVKIFSFIEIKTLLEILMKDQKYFKKFCELILIHFYKIENRNIKLSNSITNFLNIYPRITYFDINNIPFENEIKCYKNIDQLDKYILIGKPSDTFIFSNYVIPNYRNSNIPFTFCLTNRNFEVEFISSNIYYFEIEIDRYSFREPFLGEKLIIGFVSAIFDSGQFCFGDNLSFGINIFESTIMYNDKNVKLPYKIRKGDTVGMGLKFIGKDIYELIVTINGKLIEENLIDNTNAKHSNDCNEGIFIYFNNFLKIATNINCSNGIYFNFGDKPFSFNIKELINSSSVENLFSDNFINSGFKYDYIDTSVILKKNYFWKRKGKSKESIYNFTKKMLLKKMNSST